MAAAVVSPIAVKVAVAADKTTLSFPEISPKMKEFPIRPAPEKGPAAQGPGVVHGSSLGQTPLVNDPHTNAFVGMVLNAFAEHVPLELDPGVMWLLILQGVAHHVNLNAEALRHKFVNFEGKQKIHLRADDFVLGYPGNDWPRLFTQFAEQIDEKSKPGIVPLLEPAFSTTTPVERLAARITIMDVFQQFFEFSFTTMCGFPAITLHGTRADWVALHERTAGVLGLCEEKFAASWGAALSSVTARFVEAYDGKADGAFWQSMGKRGGTTGSGARTWYTGWLNVFFPYIKDDRGLVPNQYCVPYSPNNQYVREGLEEKLYSMFEQQPEGIPQGSFGGPSPKDFPPALAQAPVEWNYMGLKIDLNFFGGLVGFTQDKETHALRAVVGWEVSEPPAPKA